jgi:hypothetical protein
MVIGSRQVVTRRTPCVVFASSRVDWIWTAQVLGFEPVLVYFQQSNALVPLIHKLLPRAEIVVDSYSKMKGRALPSVAFVHGYAGAFDFLFDSVDVILSTRGKRGRLPDGWRLTKASTTHALVGGVTDCVDNCFLWSRGSTRAENAEVCVPRCLSRDVHSVVSDTVSGKPWPKPATPRLATPKVWELSPGVYHGGGLLPLDHPGGAFILRSVFTPTKWCRRRLTKPEVAMAYDIPTPIIQACSGWELNLVIQHPSRALEHCAKSLMAHEGVIDRGGRYVFTIASAPAEETKPEEDGRKSDKRERKRRKEEGVRTGQNREHAEAPCSDHAECVDWVAVGDEDGVRLDSRGRILGTEEETGSQQDGSRDRSLPTEVTSEEEGVRRQVPVSNVNKAPLKLRDRSLPTVETVDEEEGESVPKIVKAKAPTKLRDKKGSGREGDGTGVHEEDRTVTSENVEAKAPTRLGVTERLEEPGKDRQDDRDLKAVKADDAEAPVWLWNDAIRDGLQEDPINRGHTLETVDEALEAFRRFLLHRKCRLGVTRSFFTHLKIEHPELQASDRVEVRAHLEWVVAAGRFQWKYRWRPRFGRSTYKAWWNGFWENTQADKEPGRDAIWRIAEASWWEWDAGSAPIYWRWPPEYQ